MQMRQLCPIPRPLKRELAAGVLGTNADGGNVLTERGVEDSSQRQA